MASDIRQVAPYLAAKVVAKSTLEKERARAKILTEIRIHRSVANRHVVRFVRCFEDATNVYIIMGEARRCLIIVYR